MKSHNSGGKNKHFRNINIILTIVLIMLVQKTNAINWGCPLEELINLKVLGSEEVHMAGNPHLIDKLFIVSVHMMISGPWLCNFCTCLRKTLSEKLGNQAAISEFLPLANMMLESSVSFLLSQLSGPLLASRNPLKQSMPSSEALALLKIILHNPFSEFRFWSPKSKVLPTAHPWGKGSPSLLFA